MTQAPSLAGRGRSLARVLTLTTLVAAATAIGFAGCTLSRDGTMEQQCASAADCPAPNNDCWDTACTDEGSCIETQRLDEDGNPLEPPQQLGDCKVHSCDADGAWIETPEDSDSPEDVLCVTDYSCDNGELVITPLGVGDACEDGGSTGICALGPNDQLFCRFGCSPTDECPVSSNPCLEYVCNTVTWECDPTYLDNVPSPGDTDGDCGVAFCVAGVEEVTIDNSDLPPDEICSTGICAAGVPGQDPRDPGYGCAGGGDLEVCDGAGNCVECNDISTCEQLPAPTDCSYRECSVNHQCVYTHQPNGYLIGSQNAGDCKDIVCDGNGDTQVVNNDLDEPDDNNVCTDDTCNSGTPSSTACCAGDDCGTNGVCGSGGQLGLCVGCNTEADCPDVATCRTKTCEGNVCGWAPVTAGTLVTTAPSGDCRRFVCDGGGGVTWQADNDPLAPPSSCQYYVCNSGTNVLTARANGYDCPNNSFWCDGDEVCQGGSCNSPGNPCSGHNVGPNCNDSCNESLDNCTANDASGTACGSSNNTQCDNPDTCNAGTCQANNETNGTTCNDGLWCNGNDSCLSGNCSVHGTNPCPGADNDDDCSETCREANDDCNDNDPNGSLCGGGTGTCSGGICGGKANGQPCGTGAECASTYCADGVCCNNACTGDCRACDVSGSVGSCTNYSQGTDPDNECTHPGDAGPSCNAGACVCGSDPSAATQIVTDPSGQLDCPVGSNCVVTCTGSNCAGLVVNCSPNDGCAVTCSGNGSCTDLVVNCGSDGMCSLNCSHNNACSGASILCGQDSCTATCGTTKANFTANGSCLATNNNCTVVN